jgi:hypothetical protein
MKPLQQRAAKIIELAMAARVTRAASLGFLVIWRDTSRKSTAGGIINEHSDNVGMLLGAQTANVLEGIVAVHDVV